jgi:hypothetical protein
MNLPSLTTRTDARWSPRREQLRAVADQIRRALDLRVDLDRLDTREQVELVELASKIGDGADWKIDSDRVPLASLAVHERTTFERLVGKAANDETVFEKRREQTRIAEEVKKLAVRARRAGRRTRHERQGSVIFPPEIRNDIAQGILAVGDVAVLYYLLASLESGEPLHPRHRIEGTGDAAALVYDERNLGTISPRHDPDGDLGFVKMSLENLARVGWLALDKSRGPEWQVRRGQAWLDAMTRREES